MNHTKKIILFLLLGLFRISHEKKNDENNLVFILNKKTGKIFVCKRAQDGKKGRRSLDT